MLRKFFLKRKAIPADNPKLKAYLRLFDSKRKGSTPISALPFVVLDTETTSIHVKEAQLLSLGAIKIENGKIKIAEVFEAQFSSPKSSSTESIPIHGIIPKEAPNPSLNKTNLLAFLEFIGDAILVGHHTRYDMEMLNKYFKQNWNFEMLNKTLDTQVLAARILGPKDATGNPYSLDELCNHFSIKMHDRHTASGDAFLTAQVFIKILPTLSKKRVQTLDELLSRGIKRYPY